MAVRNFRVEDKNSVVLSKLGALHFLEEVLEHSSPYETSPVYKRDARGKLAKLKILSDPDIFPLGVLDEYIAYSSSNVFRGFHRQGNPHDGNKVFFVIAGEIELYTLDTAGATNGKFHLDKHHLFENGHAMVVPQGYFTGYLVKSDEAIVQVKSSSLYNPSFQRVISPHEVWSEEVTGSWMLSDQDKGSHA